MTKELEAIERVTSPGDLPSRLEAAENATVDVEKRLAKTVRIFKYRGHIPIKILKHIYYNFPFFLEWFTSRVSRGVGAM